MASTHRQLLCVEIRTVPWFFTDTLGMEWDTRYGNLLQFANLKPWPFAVTRPGKHTNITMERSTMFNGKINYFYGHFQWLFVCLPEGNVPKMVIFQFAMLARE
jgi:hypothetical protein